MLNILSFASENMPADNPGSLEMAAYVDLVAFLLDENGIELEAELTADTADDIVVNP